LNPTVTILLITSAVVGMAFSSGLIADHLQILLIDTC